LETVSLPKSNMFDKHLKQLSSKIYFGHTRMRTRIKTTSLKMVEHYF